MHALERPRTSHQDISGSGSTSLKTVMGYTDSAFFWGACGLSPCCRCCCHRFCLLFCCLMFVIVDIVVVVVVVVGVVCCLLFVVCCLLFVVVVVAFVVAFVVIVVCCVCFCWYCCCCGLFVVVVIVVGHVGHLVRNVVLIDAYICVPCRDHDHCLRVLGVGSGRRFVCFLGRHVERRVFCLQRRPQHLASPRHLCRVRFDLCQQVPLRVDQVWAQRG
jgi:hypothetical protein